MKITERVKARVRDLFPSYREAVDTGIDPSLADIIARLNALEEKRARE